jgi:hypothetical protein
VSDAGGAGAAKLDAFRFYDNREKYLLFVTTCSEKWEISERIGLELDEIAPAPPAVRVFDAGVGDATVLTRVMRLMHRRFPNAPFLVAAKEISLEDVRLSLEKMPDRFYEHPETVFVFTNLPYADAPFLAAEAQWREIGLAGATAHEFEQQIQNLQPVLAELWQVRKSEKSGNPVPVTPAVLVLFREDHRFLLDPVIPRKGFRQLGYDLVLACQPFRARSPLAFKAERVLAPLARALRPRGRLVIIQAKGEDPGMEIIRRIWPEEAPFKDGRKKLLAALAEALGPEARQFEFLAFPDKKALFRYRLHTMPSETATTIGTSTVLAAWNAAVYVAQIPDAQLDEAMAGGGYLEATREVLRRHGGLWFQDEACVVVHRA